MRAWHAVLFAFPFLLAACSGGDPNTIDASGTIEGTDVTISTQSAGPIAQVRVDEGSRVRQGDTLLVIDTTEYAIQLRQAAANLASFESQFKLAVEGSRQEDIIQAQAAFTTAQADYQRMKDLLASQSITKRQYDDAYARYVAAQQTYEKLRRGMRPEEITGARTRRDYAAAQVELLRKKLHDCFVTAPSNGTVTLRSVEPGELATVGTNVLRITDLDTVKLMIYVGDRDMGRVKLGQSADVLIDAFGRDHPFRGRVVYLSPSAEFTPKNVQTKEERTKLVFGVKIEIPNPDGSLKPGLPADARLHVG